MKYYITSSCMLILSASFKGFAQQLPTKAVPKVQLTDSETRINTLPLASSGMN